MEAVVLFVDFTSPVMLQKIEVFWDFTAKHCVVLVNWDVEGI